MTDQLRQSPSGRAGDRRAFLRRLSVYLFGVALGFVLLGVFSRARHAARMSSAPVPVQTETPAGTPATDGGGVGEGP